jgi:hypothetical protein
MRYWIPIPQTILYPIFVVYPEDVGPTYVSLPDKIVFLLPSPFFSVSLGELCKQTLLSGGSPTVKPISSAVYSDTSVGKEVYMKFIQHYGLPHFSSSEITE